MIKEKIKVDESKEERPVNAQMNKPSVKITKEKNIEQICREYRIFQEERLSQVERSNIQYYK